MFLGFHPSTPLLSCLETRKEAKKFKNDSNESKRAKEMRIIIPAGNGRLLIVRGGLHNRSACARCSRWEHWGDQYIRSLWIEYSLYFKHCPSSLLPISVIDTLQNLRNLRNLCSKIKAACCVSTLLASYKICVICAICVPKKGSHPIRDLDRGNFRPPTGSDCHFGNIPRVETRG